MNFMDEAFELAKKSLDHDDIPVGAVIVKNGEIVGRGYNQKEKLSDATAHAEIIALQDAAKNLGTYHLEDCDMYVTLEPCCMCAGAIINFRLRSVYIGATNDRFGCCGSNLNLLDLNLNHTTDAIFLNVQKCSEIISDFFKQIRTER